MSMLSEMSNLFESVYRKVSILCTYRSSTIFREKVFGPTWSLRK